MKQFIFMFSMLTGSIAFSHGEDKLGPHGGFIRMPGAYHTEVLIEGKKLKVYLLDINWKNPSTKNSTVEVTLNPKTKTPIVCQAEEAYFSCLLPKEASLTKGQLLVNSQRDGQKGSQATYNLPLKLEKNVEDEHEGHH